MDKKIPEDIPKKKIPQTSKSKNKVPKSKSPDLLNFITLNNN